MAVTNISDQVLGKILQIRYDDGVRNQLSEDHEEFKLFTSKLRKGGAEGRSQSFYFMAGYGPSATQWQGVSPAGSFPTGQRVSTAEYSAVYKEIETTIELELNLWKRAKKGPKYAEPLEIELDAKATSSKRRFAAAAHLDGTGVIMQAASATISSGQVVVTLSSSDTARGSIGAVEPQERLLPYTAAGAANNPTVSSGTFNHYYVVSKNRQAGTVTLEARNSSDAALTVTATSIVDGDVFYLSEQDTIVDLTGIGSSDYNTLTESMAGLESLTATDGRVCHGITMSGATGASRYDADGDPFDVVHIQRSMSQTKTAVGRSRYSWDNMLMAPEAEDALIEARETDRRFTSVKDGIRGTDALAYQHQNDKLEILSTEYVKKNRVLMIPKAKSNKDRVIEYWGSQFELVELGGQNQFLRPSASAANHDRFIRMYFSAQAALLCKHPKAINVIHNFTLPA